MAALDQDTLRALFTQPPADAVAYLKSKGLRITFNWQEMLDDMRGHTTTFGTPCKVRRGLILRRSWPGPLLNVATRYRPNPSHG